MMYLCIDRGNTYSKVAVFNKGEIVLSKLFSHNDELHRIKEILKVYPVVYSIVSSVVDENKELNLLLCDFAKLHIVLSHKTKLPIKNNYRTPETLGKDRLAAVTGAYTLMPDNDVLVIDAGTAITYDFIDSSGVYHGGNISPGVDLRLDVLHQQTQNLPLVEMNKPDLFMGVDTISAIQSGVFYGIILEIEGYIDRLMLKYPKLSVFLTGGYADSFGNQLKNRIFADKNLVLIGLNRILQYNVENY